MTPAILRSFDSDPTQRTSFFVFFFAWTTTAFSVVGCVDIEDEIHFRLVPPSASLFLERGAVIASRDDDIERVQYSSKQCVRTHMPKALRSIAGEPCCCALCALNADRQMSIVHIAQHLTLALQAAASIKAQDLKSGSQHVKLELNYLALSVQSVSLVC